MRSLWSLSLRFPEGSPPQSSVATLICRFHTVCGASAEQRFARAREMTGGVSTKNKYVRKANLVRRLRVSQCERKINRTVLPFPFGSLGRVALSSRGHRSRANIGTHSSRFGTHNGYPLCYEVPCSSQFVAQASSPKGELPKLYNRGPLMNRGKRNLVSQIHGIFSARPALKIREPSKIIYVARRVSRRSRTQFAHTCASAG